jgi:hypothetical protein
MPDKMTPINNTIFKYPYYNELNSTLVDHLFGNIPEPTI